jgi:Tfp pilus assembly protein PilW
VIAWRDQRGASVAELLTACAAVAAVLAALVIFQQRTLQAYVVGAHKTEVQQNARVALERMARDIRTSRTGLTAATATSVTLVDADGATVAYTLNAGTKTVTRAVGGNAQTLVGGVQALTFAYYAVNSDVPLSVPVAAPGNVFRVDITIHTKTEDTVVAGDVADARDQLMTSVRLRNL